MDKNTKHGRRYSPEEKAAAVRSRVRQTDIDDGLVGGVTSDGAEEMRRLQQENRELKRANEILRRAASFFGAEPGRQHR